MRLVVSKASYHLQKLKSFGVKVLDAVLTVVGHDGFVLVFQYGVVLLLRVWVPGVTVSSMRTGHAPVHRQCKATCNSHDMVVSLDVKLHGGVVRAMPM